MDQWAAEDAFVNVKADDFATPGENVMIVAAAELKSADHIVRFAQSNTVHDLKVLTVASVVVECNAAITVQVEEQIEGKREATNLLLHPWSHVTIERPDQNL